MTCFASHALNATILKCHFLAEYVHFILIFERTEDDTGPHLMKLPSTGHMEQPLPWPCVKLSMTCFASHALNTRILKCYLITEYVHFILIFEHTEDDPGLSSIKLNHTTYVTKSNPL